MFYLKKKKTKIVLKKKLLQARKRKDTGGEKTVRIKERKIKSKSDDTKKIVEQDRTTLTLHFQWMMMKDRIDRKNDEKIVDINLLFILFDCYTQSFINDCIIFCVQLSDQ